MKTSFINVRLGNNSNSENHNFRSDKTQSLLKENLKYFKQEKLNILNYKNKQHTYNKSGDIKKEFQEYKKLKKDIIEEHKAAYKKAYKTNPKNKIFSDSVITFSTDIIFKFQKDKNINIFLNGKNYNLDELEKLHAQTEIEFFKYEKINKKNDDKNSEDIKKELAAEKLLSDINNSIKFNFDIETFNTKGQAAIKKIAEEYNLNILYSTLHLDEKTPHFHFEFENFTRDINGNINNKARPVFKRKNGFTKIHEEDRFYVKNVGKRIQDLAAEVFEEFDIKRGVSKSTDNINEKHLHAEQKKFWEEKIKHLENLEKDLKKDLNLEKEKNKTLTYQNIGLEASNKQEVEKYKQLLTEEKKVVLEAHSKELTSLKQSSAREVEEVKNNINLLIENKKELINIFKEMRAFLAKNKNIDTNIKKILYSAFSENQTQLREDVKKLKVVKNYKHEQGELKQEISKILNNNSGIVSFDKDGANKEILNLINKYTEFNISYKQMKDLNDENEKLKNELKDKDAEILIMKEDIKNLTIIEQRAKKLEEKHEKLEEKNEKLEEKLKNIDNDNEWKFFTYIKRKILKDDTTAEPDWKEFDQFKKNIEDFLPPINLTTLQKILAEEKEEKLKEKKEKLEEKKEKLEEKKEKLEEKNEKLEEKNEKLEEKNEKLEEKQEYDEKGFPILKRIKAT